MFMLKNRIPLCATALSLFLTACENTGQIGQQASNENAKADGVTNNSPVSEDEGANFNTDLDEALLNAVQAGDAQKTKALLEQKADPDTQSLSRNNRFFKSPLWEATTRGYLQVASVLLDFHARRTYWTVHDKFQDDVVVWSVLENKIDFLRLFIEKGTSLNGNRYCADCDPSPLNVLFAAVQIGNVQALDLLLAVPQERLDREDKGWVPSLGAYVTPLGEAVRLGKLDLAKKLIDAGASPNFGLQETKYGFHYTSHGLSPLHIAVLSGNLSAVQFLIEQKSLIDIRCYDYANYRTPLEIAIDLNQAPILDLLLRSGAKVELERDYVNLATRAVLAGNSGLLERLKAAGVNLNGSSRGNRDCNDGRGFAPLHHAAQKADLKSLQELLRLGVQVDVRSDCEITPLHLASEKSLDAVAALIQAGADTNARDNVYIHNNNDDYLFESTPLTRAAQYNQLEVAKKLVAEGADIQLKVRRSRDWRSPWLESPLAVAVDFGSPDMVAYLVDQKSDVQWKNPGQQNLIVAATTLPLDRYDPIVTKLAGAGVSLNELDSEGYGPLHHLFIFKEAQKDVAPKVALLVRLGAQVDARSKGESTALMAAAGLWGPGYLDAVKTLLNAGADPTLQNAHGLTAGMIAHHRGYEDIAALLCEGNDEACRPSLWQSMALTLY